MRGEERLWEGEGRGSDGMDLVREGREQGENRREEEVG